METPPIFRIPLSLRLQIYELVCEWNRILSSKRKRELLRTALLRVCRQMYTEALAVNLGILEKGITSFDTLIECTSGPYAHLIPHIGKVYLYHSTVDELFKIHPVNSPGLPVSSGPQVWGLRYQQLRDQKFKPDHRYSTRSTSSSTHSPLSNYIPYGAVDKLGTAISILSNVKALYLAMNTDYPMSDYSIEFQLVTEMVSSNMASLRRLDLIRTPNSIPLDFLRNLRNLRHFQFCGYSKSTSEEIVEIFQCLNRLESLKIDAQEPSDEGIPCSTHDIIRQIPHLKSLFIRQRGPMPFISIQMLEALHPHKESLRSLALYWIDENNSCSPEIVLDPAAFGELVGLVSTLGRLEYLSLDFYVPWTNGNFDIKPLVPASIVESRVSFRDCEEL